MQTYNINFLEKNRMGNNANDQEWEIIVKWLSTGKLNSKEEMQICYENIQKNKKWYSYIVGSQILPEEPTMIFFKYSMIPVMIMLGVLSLVEFCFGIKIPDDQMLNLLFAQGLVISIPAIFLEPKIEEIKTVENLKEVLELGLGINHKKKNLFEKIKDRLFSRGNKKDINIQESLSDYVDKELAEKGTNKDEEIMKRQNEVHASAFVKMIGDDIKNIYANPYPDCQKELDALQQLSHDYVEYMIKENEAKEAGKIVLRLPGSNNFYTKLGNLEARIKDNMKINKLREYNKGYIDDIVKDASKAVEQNNQPIYTGPVVNGHIPTVEEQFYAELQNYNTADTEDKGHGRVLSPNNK